jgi:hypothetical protein
MSPFSRSLEFNQLVVELFPHRDDSISHLLDLGQPTDQRRSSEEGGGIVRSGRQAEKTHHCLYSSGVPKMVATS